MIRLKMAEFQLLILNVLTCVVLVATAPDRIQRQAFRTTTLTVTDFSTEFATITTTASVICAQLVNVTGVCRRRKDLKMEEPIVMIFDEGFNEIEDYFFPTAIRE